MYLNAKIDNNDFYIRNIFTLDDKLDGKYASSNILKCIPNVNISFLNNTNNGNEIIFEKVNNFKWKIKYDKAIITDVNSSFTEGIQKDNNELYIKFNNLKIIGKNLAIYYIDDNSNISNTTCTIIEDIKFDFIFTNTDTEKINSSYLNYITVISTISIIIIIIILMIFYCMKKKKKTRNGFRLVSLSTGNSQIF
jgi:hypothetical protein